jgi:hypothetical protein
MEALWVDYVLARAAFCRLFIIVASNTITTVWIRRIPVVNINTSRRALPAKLPPPDVSLSAYHILLNHTGIPTGKAQDPKGRYHCFFFCLRPYFGLPTAPQRGDHRNCQHLVDRVNITPRDLATTTSDPQSTTMSLPRPITQVTSTRAASSPMAVSGVSTRDFATTTLTQDSNKADVDASGSSSAPSRLPVPSPTPNLGPNAIAKQHTSRPESHIGRDTNNVDSSTVGAHVLNKQTKVCSLTWLLLSAQAG